MDRQRTSCGVDRGAIMAVVTKRSANAGSYEAVKHSKIDMTIRRVARSGMCPICGEKPSKQTTENGGGITCGDLQCVRFWLFPAERHKQQAKQRQQQPQAPSGQNYQQRQPVRRAAPTQQTGGTMANYLADQKLALLAIDDHPSQDDKTISPKALDILTQYYAKYKTPLPPNDNALLITVHKLRVKVKGLPPEAAEKSAQWLQANGQQV